MPRINQLPPDIVAKIAAGEVILDSADEIEVLSLDPRPRDEGTFHGQKAIVKVAITDKAETNGTLVKHEGGPTSMAEVVLLFPDNDFIRGVCLPVDGGRNTRRGEDFSIECIPPDVEGA